MNKEDKIKLINQGYSLELFTPIEFKSAIQKKMADLQKNGNDKARWKALMKGWELSIQERVKRRQKELAKAKMGQEKDNSRTR